MLRFNLISCQSFRTGAIPCSIVLGVLYANFHPVDQIVNDQFAGFYPMFLRVLGVTPPARP